MDIKVIADGSEEHSSLLTLESAFFVEQANMQALVEQKSFYSLQGRSVKALVPDCNATCTSQNSKESFDKLVCCYVACIGAAVAAGAKVVVVRPLGVGIPIYATTDDGTTVQMGVKGNLFWTYSKTSAAAKQAVESTSDWNVTVVFVVPKAGFDDWDHAMDF